MTNLTIGALALAAGLVALPATAGDGTAAALAQAKAAVTKRDYATAFNLLKPLAEGGDAAAQVRFGELYSNGTGVPRDLAAAAGWYQKAADQGYAEGEYLAADAYLNAEGNPQDVAAALTWYRKAADQDYAAADLALDSIYYMGWGVETDKKAAAAWHEKALAVLTPQAEAGDAEAQTTLALSLGDLAAEKRWLEKAASTGYAPAEVALANMFAWDEAFKNDRLASYWYQKAAEAGNTEAQHQMAEMAEDAATTVRWTKLAAEGGSAWDQYDLSQTYRDGEDIPKDDAEAVKWLREAAEGGPVDAQLELAERYADGDGVARDPAMSVKWYLRAAFQWDGRAQYRLGVAYAKGDGVAADPVEAYKWFAIALANKHWAYSDVPDEAAKARNDLAGHMSDAQIAQAEAEAKAYQPSVFEPPLIVPREPASPPVTGDNGKTSP